MGTKPQRPSFFLLILSILCASGATVDLARAQVTAHINGQAILRGLDGGIHPDSPTRTRIDLSGEWVYSIDGETWHPVRIPSSLEYDGRIVFRRRFTITDSLLTASSFKFVALGINYEAEVAVNEIFVGRHVGGTTSFEFDIPEDALQLGQENTITVTVNDRLTGRTTIPLRQQVWGWKNYAGILRDVFLVAVPRTWIERFTALTSVEEEMGVGSVEIRSILTHKPARDAHPEPGTAPLPPVAAALQVELIDRATGAVVASAASPTVSLEPNKNVALPISFKVAGVRLWSPESPEFYVLRATLVVPDAKPARVIDQTSVNVGFTSVRMDGNGVIVNGKRAIINGVVWHEDAPRTGASLTYEQMERDIVLIKSLGANAVRFAFHPPHPYMLNLCSRYGLFALEEVPVWNAPADILADEAFATQAEAQVREMVERDQSVPALLAWGIGNAFDSADERAAVFVRRMRDAVRTLDRRPVYAGTALVHDDRCAAFVDLAAVIPPTGDLRTFRRDLMDWKAAHAKQPVLVLEYAKEVDHRNRNGYSDPMSQEAQARFFLQYYGAIKEAAVAGSFANALADWRGDRPVLTLPFEDRTLHPLGLTSAQREKRLSYEMLRVLYNDEKISALPAGSYRSVFPIVHVLTGLCIIILIGYQYGYNRRFSEALKRSLLRSYNFFADLRDLRTVSSLHTLLLAACVSVTLAVLLSAILYHFRADRVFDYVLTFFVTSDVIKARLIWATWNPFGGILAMTALFFVAGILLAAALMIVGLIVKAHTSWFHVYSVSTWGAAPIVFLSPVAMALFKIMENSYYVVPSLLLIVAFLVWTFLRVLKGVSVVFDIRPARTYIGGIALVLLACGGLVLYYEATYAFTSYVAFVVHLVQSLS